MTAIQPMSDRNPEFVTLVSLARQLGIHKVNMYSLKDRGHIATETHNGRLLVRLDEAERFAEKYQYMKRDVVRSRTTDTQEDTDHE